jgi:peptide/nickel transport system permease protein
LKKYLAYKSIGLSTKQFWALFMFCLIAIAHNFIANDKYIIGKTQSGFEFLVESEDAKSGIKAIIPYSANTVDKHNRKVGPFSKQNVSSLYYRHWLGTDSLGRDVLAGIINGSYIALWVGLFSVIMSLVLGIFFGFLSGYYGDTGVQLKKSTFVLWLALTLLCWFYSFYTFKLVALIFFILPVLILGFLVHNASGISRGGFRFPFDTIIFRMIEIISSIPSLFIILIILTLLGKSTIWNVIIIIGILRWPNVARHLRAEILKIKQEQFIDSARSIGQTDIKIFLYHVLPMAASPLIIICAFGFATSILLESTLSFLGIGVPLDVVTWGSLIKEARFHFDAWWLALFPGLMIYGLIYLFNSIGDNINQKIRSI